MKRVVLAVMVLALMGCAVTVNDHLRCGIIKPKALWCRTVF